MFIDEAIEARASWSTIEPQDNRILQRVSFRNNKVVEKILLRTFTYAYISTISPSPNIY
jgi:hypothetical protein